ncbi:MAG TPA: sortase, partial [Candidatus Limnocylindrales bacterium]
SVLATSSPSLVRASIGEGRPAIVTLAASLDRSAVSTYREDARLAAVAATHPPAPVHHKAAPHRRHVVTHHRATVVNHLWIPALGISRSVVWFPCSRSREPGQAVYRWGCAGRNNVYLFAHAGGAFQALHDAYLSGKLRVGMVATYANAAGHVTHYRVTAWKVVSPSDISWSSSLRHLGMTLQTCVGTNNAYRLDVRLESY